MCQHRGIVKQQRKGKHKVDGVYISALKVRKNDPDLVVDCTEYALVGLSPGDLINDARNLVLGTDRNQEATYNTYSEISEDSTKKIYASRDIEINEEFFIDYGEAYDFTSAPRPREIRYPFHKHIIKFETGNFSRSLTFNEFMETEEFLTNPQSWGLAMETLAMNIVASQLI